MRGEFKPDDMVLVWAADNQGRVTGARIRGRGPDTPETRVFPKSWGACNADWMDGSPLESPLGLFSKLAVRDGFASEQARRELIVEFTRVEGQAWAQELLWEVDGRPERDD